MRVTLQLSKEEEEEFQVVHLCAKNERNEARLKHFETRPIALSRVSLKDKLSKRHAEKNWLTDWLIDRYTNKLTLWQTNWLTHSQTTSYLFTDCWIQALIDWLTGRQTAWQTDGSTERQTDKPINWLEHWLTAYLLIDGMEDVCVCVCVCVYVYNEPWGHKKCRRTLVLNKR